MVFFVFFTNESKLIIMSKKISLALAIIVTVTLFVKCGPAAEDRDKMHAKAKRVSDSIARVVDSALVIRQ